MVIFFRIPSYFVGMPHTLLGLLILLELLQTFLGNRNILLGSLTFC